MNLHFACIMSLYLCIYIACDVNAHISGGLQHACSVLFISLVPTDTRQILALRYTAPYDYLSSSQKSWITDRILYEQNKMNYNKPVHICDVQYDMRQQNVICNKCLIQIAWYLWFSSWAIPLSSYGRSNIAEEQSELFMRQAWVQKTEYLNVW